MLRSLYSARSLAWLLAQREIRARFQGSALGIFWILVTPLLMLAVYTLVFSLVFKARWPGIQNDGPFAYAIVLFSSLIVFQLFSEVVGKAPLMVTGNPNYVTKVVFPLEILPLVSLLATLMQTMVSFGILLVFYLFLMGLPPPTALLVPLAIAPLLAMVLGISWLLASLGVFLRDLHQLIGWLVTVLMFTSPVFYPISSVPPLMREWMMLNPLTLPLEWVKSLLFMGKVPDLLHFTVYAAVSIAVLHLGYGWFTRTKKAFADVL
jgi:lipopolysaccharide transport system permease protein